MQVTDDHSQVGGYTAAQFHPDGLILGTGTAESAVRIWEVRQQKVCLRSSILPLNHPRFEEQGVNAAECAKD